MDERIKFIDRIIPTDSTCMRHLRNTTLHHDSRLEDAFIRDEQRQLEIKTRLYEEVNIDKVDMTGTIASSGLTSLGPDK